MFEAAKRNEKAAPRKHHVVPDMYLRSWAVDGRIRVTETDTKRTWVTSPGRAARRTDFYRLEDDELDPDSVPPLLFETILGRVESEAALVVRKLAEQQPHGDWVQSNLSPEHVIAMSNFVAFQALRGPWFREVQEGQLSNAYQLLYAHLTEEPNLRTELAERLGRAPSETEVEEHLGLMRGLASGEVTIAPADAAATGFIGEMAQEIVPHLLQRNWRVFTCTKPLVTCDEPVVVLGGPGTRRGEVAGYWNAAVVIMPLTPNILLGMFRPDIEFTRAGAGQHLAHTEVSELNQELVANSSHHVFEQPNRHVGEALSVPKRPRVCKVEEGYTKLDEPGAEVVRFYRRNRWANCAPKPPWPVSRWWQLVIGAPWAGPIKDEFRIC